MASVNLNALTEVQNPASTDNLLLFNETSNVATRIDYDKLAEAILNKTRDEIGGVSPISAIATLNSRLPHLNYINATSFQEATDLQPDTYLNVIDISGTTDVPVSSRNRWFGFQYLNATKKYGVQIAFTFGLAALYMRWRNNSDTWTEWIAIQ